MDWIFGDMELMFEHWIFEYIKWLVFTKYDNDIFVMVKKIWSLLLMRRKYPVVKETSQRNILEVEIRDEWLELEWDSRKCGK